MAKVMRKKVCFAYIVTIAHMLTLPSVVESKEGIEDMTSTNLVNLRRVIYLTIMNALNFEEAVHKLLKVQLDEGQEVSSFVYRLGIHDFDRVIRLSSLKWSSNVVHKNDRTRNSTASWANASAN